MLGFAALYPTYPLMPLQSHKFGAALDYFPWFTPNIPELVYDISGELPHLDPLGKVPSSILPIETAAG